MLSASVHNTKTPQQVQCELTQSLKC